MDIPHAFGHTWENCYAMSLTTRHRTFLYHFETNGARIICPIAERRYAGQVDIVTPYGFSGFAGVGQSMEFSQAWLRFRARARMGVWVYRLESVVRVCGTLPAGRRISTKRPFLPGFMAW